MKSVSRRRFLEDSLLASLVGAAALGGAKPGEVLAQKSVSANERLGVAVIGAGSRGGSPVNYFAKDGRTKILFICDPDLQRAEAKCVQVEKKHGYKPKPVDDFRKILEEPSLDIVSCASTNHWHALTAVWALQAGKHCYIEKPISHNIHEGKAIVAAAKKYGKVFQTGTQRRSATNVRELIQFIHDGGIGEVKFARGLCYKRRRAIGSRGNYPVPEGIDYDLWSGPAPVEPVTRPNFHYDWHWQRLYGNGDLGNQGPHQTDVARWALGLERFPQSVISYGGRLGYEAEKKDPNYLDAGDTANTEVTIYDYGDKCIVFETRGLSTSNRMLPVGEDFGTQVGNIIYGSKGYGLFGSARKQAYNESFAFDLEGKLIKAFSGGNDDDHYDNFLKAILVGDPSAVHADARCGALSAALSHLGNISYYLGEANKVSPKELQSVLEGVKSLDDNGETFQKTVRHLEDNGVDLKRTPLALGPLLKIDVEKEVFIGNDKANELLTRNYRAPYVVPKPEEV